MHFYYLLSLIAGASWGFNSFILLKSIRELRIGFSAGIGIVIGVSVFYSVWRLGLMAIRRYRLYEVNPSRTRKFISWSIVLGVLAFSFVAPWILAVPFRPNHPPVLHSPP